VKFHEGRKRVLSAWDGKWVELALGPDGNQEFCLNAEIIPEKEYVVTVWKNTPEPSILTRGLTL